MFFFLVFAVVLVVFMVLVVFLGFYSGFELLTTKTAVNTKNNHEL